MKEAILVLDKYMEETDAQVAEVLKGDGHGQINGAKLEYLTRRQHEIMLCMNRLTNELVKGLDNA